MAQRCDKRECEDAMRVTADSSLDVRKQRRQEQRREGKEGAC